MQDQIVVFGSLGACFVLGQVEGVPTWVTDFGSLGIVGFVVWFTLTRLETALGKLGQSISALNESVKTLKGEHAQIHEELSRIEKDLEK